MDNVWLKFGKARSIAEALQRKYFDQPYGDVDDLLELRILDDLWKHPFYTDDMSLNIIWDERERMLWLQIGFKEGYVPR